MKFALGLAAVALQIASPAGASVLAELHVLTEGEEYRVAVSEANSSGRDRKIFIESLRGCNPSVRFEAPAPGFPLGVLQPTDKYDMILVIWGGATTTTVQAFSVGHCKIAKTLERHAVTVPAIGLAPDGKPFLETIEKLDRRRGAVRTTWSWDGSRFNSWPVR